MARTKDLILDPASLDLTTVVADIDAIRSCNQQRFEMEQLTAVVLDDPDQGVIAGYKDITDAEFWVRGHMPSAPLMPGVMMCEAAAQLCSFHVVRHRLMESSVIGFGGLDSVRFRGMVHPGSRLVIVAQRLQVRPSALVRCRFQCFVENQLVCEGQMLGIPIPAEVLRRENPTV
ncbi:3-hydroxyacyl-[acyl-carrier-protein] dehydratase FabZ [Pirellulimonas nuda]|uniref:3-hydroxyacyl-[acyl-carrier-protein] dehydratase FabZ n=1 Tax=Pirellulimonas nuda TaxID=2528009 RepID=A0A518D9E2_9BACT|nr:beta-hydroxyacyl-ACP dehydratase [Pirellulimonas nuda]QDU88101.1 3-hydroxyacyl-[acyl-carrier-protein] dehydratase FabZ [Pirellulimonas nuda]